MFKQLFKGDAPIQNNENVWQHWCREKNGPLTLIFMDYCDHCNDPSPLIQKEIDHISAATLRNEWCELHTRVYEKFGPITGCPDCLQMHGLLGLVK